ncbi:hypothetical protein SSX86_019923 [Deinandra increscens subsp. villosa]|uniref:Uncharacterized protein n=1 Tax=Deinandra increscens subsp. villosa TaxID=3103831 RepID=A0AAP0CTQ2_9ASTR
MGWFIRDGRSGLSWADQTLGSMSAPPMRLLAFLGLVILLMSMSTYAEFKVHIEREKMALKLFFYLLPLALFLVAYVTMRYRLPYVVRAASLPMGSGKQDGCSPWGVAFLVVLVLVLVKYHSAVQLGWF